LLDSKTAKPSDFVGVLEMKNTKKIASAMKWVKPAEMISMPEPPQIKLYTGDQERLGVG